MKHLLSLTFAAILLAGLVGCTTTHVSQYSSPVELKLKAEKAPVVTVGGEIVGKATVYRVLFFKFGPDKFADGVNYGGQASVNIFGESTIQIAKDAAAYDACVKNGADIIVAPRYTVKNENYIVFEKTTATVKGFKGNYKVQK